MSGFVFHPEAASDLEEISQFIAADSVDAADRVLDEIRAAIHNLVSFPESGILVRICAPVPCDSNL